MACACRRQSSCDIHPLTLQGGHSESDSVEPIFTPRARVFLRSKLLPKTVTAYGGLELIQEAIHAVLVPVWKNFVLLVGESGKHLCRNHKCGPRNRRTCYGSTLIGKRILLNQHGYFCLIARQTFSDVNGSSISRTPTALKRALPTADGIVKSPLSPIPFAPYGPGPFPFSNRIVTSSSGKSFTPGTR